MSMIGDMKVLKLANPKAPNSYYLVFRPLTYFVL